MSNLKRQDEREASAVVKVQVKIENAWLQTFENGRSVLRGYPLDHPNFHLNGRYVHTSTVQRVDGNVVETRNTIYNVISWLDEDGIKAVKDDQLKLF